MQFLTCASGLPPRTTQCFSWSSTLVSPVFGSLRVKSLFHQPSPLSNSGAYPRTCKFSICRIRLEFISLDPLENQSGTCIQTADGTTLDLFCSAMFLLSPYMRRTSAKAGVYSKTAGTPDLPAGDSHIAPGCEQRRRDESVDLETELLADGNNVNMRAHNRCRRFLCPDCIPTYPARFTAFG